MLQKKLDGTVTATCQHCQCCVRGLQALTWLRALVGPTAMLLLEPSPSLTICMAPNSHMVEDAAKDSAVTLLISLADEHPAQHQGQAPEGHNQAGAVGGIVLNGEAPATGERGQAVRTRAMQDVRHSIMLVTTHGTAVHRECIREHHTALVNTGGTVTLAVEHDMPFAGPYVAQ